MSRPVNRYHSAVPDDIVEISNYLNTQSRKAALRFPRAVAMTIHQVSRRPTSGSRLEVGGIGEGLRKTSVVKFPNHLLIYHQIADGIRVVGVVHGARDLRRFLRSRQ